VVWPKSHFLYLYVVCCAGFVNLALPDQMNLLQSTWLDIICLNLVYRSVPYSHRLVYADDFKCNEEEAARFGSPPELDAVSRKLAKKLTDLNITKEEYVVLKAMLLLNPGERKGLGVADLQTFKL